MPFEPRPRSVALIRVGAESLRIDTVVNNLDSMCRNDLFVHIALAHAFRHRRRPTGGGVRKAIDPLAQRRCRILSVRTFYFTMDSAYGGYTGCKSRDPRENTGVEHVGVNNVRSELAEIGKKPPYSPKVEPTRPHPQRYDLNTGSLQFIYKCGGLQHRNHGHRIAARPERSRKLCHNSLCATRCQAR